MHRPHSSAHRNRLADETSPYLLQHAGNPVDWHPWGPEALEQARAEDKPILLSIGYSACHWCHVMAHESFEDEATAAVMNASFVNIKVDREERPDLDRIYQTAHQMLTQRGGGWPLTMFLSPRDHRPFFGGTYFPVEPKYGMPAFRDVLQRVAAYYAQHGAEIASQGDALVQVFGELLPPPAEAGLELSRVPLGQARESLQRDFDGRFGGFGDAPKFPHPMNLEFLLRTWRATADGDHPDLQALYMATLTLTRMAEGGLYDQLGGGFCRYSVDPYWMIPHFEKMLYDNGQLLAVTAQAAVATGDPLFRRVTEETADWMLRDMAHPAGGYYSTLDADSEGHEGRFYVWTPDQVRELVTPGEYAVLSKRFGLDREANFEGLWHLHVFKGHVAGGGGDRAQRRRGDACARCRASEAARGAQRPRLAGPRREDPHGMERARNRRPRRRRTNARARRLCRIRGARRCVPARALLVRRPPACGPQGRSITLPGLPGRPRIPRLGPARAAAGAVARAVAGLGDRTRRHDARALRGPRSRRLLLHRRRSRAVDPEAEDVWRRCHAFGQRRCRPSTDPARAPARRDALPRRRRAHAARVLGRAGEISPRAHLTARGTRRTDRPAGHRRRTRAARGPRHLAHRTRQALRPAALRGGHSGRRDGSARRPRRQAAQQQRSRTCVAE